MGGFARSESFNRTNLSLCFGRINLANSPEPRIRHRKSQSILVWYFSHNKTLFLHLDFCVAFLWVGRFWFSLPFPNILLCDKFKIKRDKKHKRGGIYSDRGLRDLTAFLGPFHTPLAQTSKDLCEMRFPGIGKPRLSPILRNASYPKKGSLSRFSSLACLSILSSIIIVKYPSTLVKDSKAVVV